MILQSLKPFLVPLLSLIICRSTSLYCQVLPVDSGYKVVIAGKQYNISESRRKNWGEHYRKEWNEPVRVKIAMLDTLAGGLTPYQTGGGRQSKTLRLRDRNEREYVLRSIDKSFGKALPEIAQGTFLETIANDQVSIGHPYAAITIAPMAAAAGIYHTRPAILFIPRQHSLGKYNDEFGDQLYLFEQRPDENWEVADNFGNAKNIVGTEKLFEKLDEDNDRKVDQTAYVRSRLFDLLIGDWGRHEDQWRWAEFKNDDKVIYQPIPRDRDQAFTLFDGKMVKIIFSVGGLNHLQSFDPTIEDVPLYNFPARHLDRRMTNELTLEQWMNAAKDLQARLTDTIISSAIRQMPPEVFVYSGQQIINKIKSRRDHLTEYAKIYYDFLAKNVDIPGSDKKEQFEVRGINGEKISVRVFKVKKDGTLDNEPFYSRVFKSEETEEIRLYGRDGKDNFDIRNDIGNKIKLRVIPGKGADSIHDESTSRGSRRMIHVYDHKRPGSDLSNNSRMHLTKDSMKNDYQYDHFEYDDKGFVFKPGLTIGVGYKITKQGWSKTPFATQHRWMLYYGPNRGSMGAEYRFIINQIFGKWNLEAIANADFPYVAHYFGTGNESVMNPHVNRKFYRYRSTRFSGGFDLNRSFDSVHHIHLTGLFQSIKIKNDEDRYISKDFSGIPDSVLDRKFFLSAGAAYQYKKSDHPVVPMKGYEFNIGATYTQNVQDWNRAFATYSTSASVYIPFLKKLSLAIRVGGSTVEGDAEFYQLATLSGKENLRGYRRQRFYGKTNFYNNNELRLLLDARNSIFNGKVGLIAFMDQGRIWHPGENSDKWHRSGGAGFFFAPFNRILFNATYGVSTEDRVIHIRIGFFF
jgi:hypothetical protein